MNSKQTKKTNETNSCKGNFNYSKSKDGKYPRGKRNYHIGTSKPSDTIPVNDDTRKSNDASWYYTTEAVGQQVGNIPYSLMTGLGVPLDMKQYSSETDPAGVYTNSAVVANGSICTIHYLPSIGVTKSSVDGINTAARQLYSVIRMKNSGAKNYEAPDVMMYVLAMRDIYRQYFEAYRALGVAQSFTALNRNLPDRLLYAMGINAADLRANFAQYAARLNILGAKINALPVPKYFDIFKRTALLASNVFSDSTSVRGQFYVFRSFVNYTWSGTTSTTGTELVANRISSRGINMSTALDNLTTAIEAIYSDNDAGTMGGDILKAFESDLYQVPEFNYQGLEPVYEETILSQIENMSFLCNATALYSSSPFEDANLNVTQSNGLMKFAPKVISTDFGNTTADGESRWALRTILINSHKDNPTYKDSIEYTRLISTYDITGESTLVRLESSGTEIVYMLTVHLAANTNTISYLDINTMGMLGATTVAAVSSEDKRKLAALEQFDWHPFLYIGTNSNTDKTYGVSQIAGDLRWYSTVQPETISKIHDVAILSLYFKK